MLHGSNASPEDIVLDVSNLTEYIHTLKQRHLVPFTTIDKLRSIHLFIEYISENHPDNQHTIRKCKITQKRLGKRSKALRKDMKIQRMSNALKGERDVKLASKPKEFFSDSKVKAKVISILDKADECSYLSDEHCTILAYLAAKLMLKNSQRPGPIENMTIKEFDERTPERENKFLIRVLHHKTAASTEPADLITSKALEELLLDTYEPTLHPKARSSPTFFLIHTGNVFHKVTETIRKVAEDYSVIVPTASVHRKVTATTAHCEDNLTEGQMRSLNRHMSHSSATSSKYYQLPAAKKAVDAYNTIQHLIKKHFLMPRKTTSYRKNGH